jgi:hypothetical protein
MDVSIPITVLLLTALTGVLLFLMFRRRSHGEPEPCDEERTSLWSWALFWSQLRALWAAFVVRFRHRAGERDAAPTGSALGAPVDLAEIRAIYRRLLHWAATLRHPRRPAHTPLELARELAAAVPIAASAVAAITDRYNEARYGEREVAARELAALRQAVLQLEGLTERPATNHVRHE